MRLRVEREPGRDSDGQQIVAGMLALMSTPLTVFLPLHDPSLTDRMAVLGTEEIDGSPTDLVSITGVTPSWQLLGLAGEFEARVWIGTEDHRVHRLLLWQIGTAASPEAPGRGIEYARFREVEGVEYPSRMEVRAPGLDEESSVDRFEESIEELGRRLAEMPGPPEAARAEVEAAITRMERMREALAVVRRLQANPPTVVESLDFRVGR